MRKFLIGLVFSFCGFMATADTVTIAALGDSLTHGYGLPPEQGFVPRLETWLTEHGADVSVINAGVSGDTTAGGAARAAWTLTPEVDAMIVALGGNDLLRGIDPAVSRANLTAILEAAQKADVEVLLVGMQAPGNYGPAYKEAFDAIYPELAHRFETEFVDSFFVGLMGDNTDLSQARQYFQADGIHPNAAGVELVVDGLGPFVLALSQKAAP